MADITETTDYDPYGDLEYRVDWTDNHGVRKRRYFRSKGAAERHALRVEVTLLNHAVREFLKAHHKHRRCKNGMVQRKAKSELVH
jgi:hypothetical protein